MSTRHVVIVGGGLAAHRAASALAGCGDAVRVTVVGDEPHRPYDRPPLSKGVLSGATPEDDCRFRGDGLEGVEWRLGRPAVALDPAARVLTLEGGEALGYDGLVIATGRRARTLPAAEGLTGVLSLRSLDDVRALRTALDGAASVAIVGAGFVGCEVAATLRGPAATLRGPAATLRGGDGDARPEVTLVDTAPHPLPVLGPELGARAAALHEARGVRLRMGVGVARFTGEGAVTGLDLDDGTHVPADLVLVAVGSLPNSEWLSGSGLALDRGAVVVDEHCFALGHEDIVAAGDVSAWPHPDADGPVSIEHWSNAQAMGTIAAGNLACEPADREAHAALPSFWSDQYDVKLQSIGFVGSADRFVVVLDEPERPVLVAEAFCGERLVGAVTFNRPRAMLQYQRRLREEAAAAR
ncbi:Rhodocoxin reductase [Paraconexibacter sp. AEG42_29]|uniref:Rhodocoxin reductase n=1 Tax=Paraconexibacter sp. AEG42_29 TaxID=2997339 RepID=A0AAU7APE8_9ACTN